MGAVVNERNDTSTGLQTCLSSILAIADIAEHIASFMPGNDVTCNLRLVNKTAAASFSDAKYRVVRTSQPVPRHAFAKQWLTPGAMEKLTKRQRERVVCMAAASGDRSAFEAVTDRSGLLPPPEAWDSAAGAGDLRMCIWLLGRDCVLNREGAALSAAAAGGHRTVCEWLLARGCKWNSAAVIAAASGGHLELMDWLLQLQGRYQGLTGSGPQGWPLLVAAFAAAAEGCDLAALQRVRRELLCDPLAGDTPAERLRAQRLQALLFPLAEERPLGQAGGHHDGEAPGEGQQPRPRLESHHLLEAYGAALAGAAGSPTPDWRSKVEWLEARGYRYLRPAKACEKAAGMPDALERLTWLRQRGYHLNEAAVTAAAGAGNVAALRFLLAERARADATAALAAAKGGHLQALQVLHAAGCRFDAQEALHRAVAGGHLAVVAWLAEVSGVPGLRLDGNVSSAAGRSGSVELLAWLRARGVLDMRAAFTAAVSEGSESALEWLADVGFEMQGCGSCFHAAIQRGDLAGLRCLRRLGCTWGPDKGALFTACVEDGTRLPVLSWMLDEGCPVDWRAAGFAAGRRSDAEWLAEWLEEQEQRARNPPLGVFALRAVRALVQKALRLVS